MKKKQLKSGCLSRSSPVPAECGSGFGKAACGEIISTGKFPRGSQLSSSSGLGELLLLGNLCLAGSIWWQCRAGGGCCCQGSCWSPSAGSRETGARSGRWQRGKRESIRRKSPARTRAEREPKKKGPKKKSRRCVRFPPESARRAARCYLGQRWAGILKYHIVEFILSLINQVLVMGGSGHPCHSSALLAGRSVKAGLGSWHVQEGCCRAVCPSQAQVSAGAGLISSTATFWGSSYVGEPR